MATNLRMKPQLRWQWLMFLALLISVLWSQHFLNCSWKCFSESFHTLLPIHKSWCVTWENTLVNLILSNDKVQVYLIMSTHLNWPLNHTPSISHGNLKTNMVTWQPDSLMDPSVFSAWSCLTYSGQTCVSKYLGGSGVQLTILPYFHACSRSLQGKCNAISPSILPVLPCSHIPTHLFNVYHICRVIHTPGFSLSVHICQLYFTNWHCN